MVNLVGVYMMPAQNLIIYGNESYRYEITLVTVLEQNFHSSTKAYSDVM